MKIKQPSLDENLVLISLLMPVSVRNCLDTIARRQMRSRSDIIRTHVVDGLHRQGLVAAEEDAAA